MPCVRGCRTGQAGKSVTNQNPDPEDKSSGGDGMETCAECRENIHDDIEVCWEMAKPLCPTCWLDKFADD